MVKQDPHRAGMLRPGPTPGIPKQLQASYRLWLVAVAAGVFETTLVVWSTPPPGRSAQSYRGATAEVGDDRPPLATATRWWVHRRGPLDHPAQDQARIAAARRHGTAVEPFASGVYVNDLTDEGKQASGGRTHRHADAAGGAEGPLRPRQSLPPQPQHPPRKEQPGDRPDLPRDVRAGSDAEPDTRPRFHDLMRHPAMPSVSAIRFLG
jgi:hypothetical protein